MIPIINSQNKKCYVVLDADLEPPDSVRGVFSDLDDALSWTMNWIADKNNGVYPDGVIWTYDAEKCVYRPPDSSLMVVVELLRGEL